MSLLDEAKKYKKAKRVVTTDEHIELAIGWLKEEVGISAINKVLHPDKNNNYSGNCLYALAIHLREAYRQGKLKIKE
jgi:uncharacterized protein (DUF4213/DUF364 family)